MRSGFYALRITAKAFVAALFRRPGGADAVVRRELEAVRTDLEMDVHDWADAIIAGGKPAALDIAGRFGSEAAIDALLELLYVTQKERDRLRPHWDGAVTVEFDPPRPPSADDISASRGWWAMRQRGL